jgi:hypothetical protein
LLALREVVPPAIIVDWAVEIKPPRDLGPAVPVLGPGGVAGPAQPPSEKGEGRAHRPAFAGAAATGADAPPVCSPHLPSRDMTHHPWS